MSTDKVNPKPLHKEAKIVGKVVKGSKEAKLTGKQKAFADELINNPKQSATKAVLKTYNVNNRRTASVVASENLTKPNVLKYLDAHSTEAENVLIEVMGNARRYKTKPAFQRLAKDTADSILDRVHGKATTKVESTSINANLNLEASAELNDRFTAFLKADTTQ